MQVKKVTIFVIFFIAVTDCDNSFNFQKKLPYRRHQKWNRATEPEFELNSVLQASSISNIFDNYQRTPNVEYINAILGQDVVLPCKVKNLGSHNILWLRLKDGDVIAYDNMTVTQDHRFMLEKRFESESNLIIREVKLSDSGDYACQINTPNLKSKIINLMILSNKILM